MHDGHEIRQCVHGAVERQCRCMQPGKRVVIVPCPKTCPRR